MFLNVVVVGWGGGNKVWKQSRMLTTQMPGERRLLEGNRIFEMAGSYGRLGYPYIRVDSG